jgi:hypothetical protein
MSDDDYNDERGYLENIGYQILKSTVEPIVENIMEPDPLSLVTAPIEFGVNVITAFIGLNRQKED